MANKALPSVVTSVQFSDASVTLALSDGRTVIVPIGWLPGLKEATADQRAKWQISDDGKALEWSDPKAKLDIADLVSAGGGVATEDSVLYVFGAALLVLIGIYFWSSTNLVRNMLHERAADPRVETAFLTDNIPRSYLGAQVHLTLRRYDHAAAVILANSARNNTGFLVGALLAFLGCLIVIRRVRDTSFQATAESAEVVKASLTASSPGIILATLGTAIILTTLISRDTSEVEDTGILMPGAEAVPVLEGQPVADGTDKVVDTKALQEANVKLKESLSK
jgi:hypothetical protein